ncbi:MAG: hypothetical protein WC022_03340 [Parcubacteria group bacterium]
MKDLIQDTIARIEKEHIVPEPKWKYLLRKYGLWLIFATILILAALSFAVMLDNGRNLDWDLYHFTHQHKFSYILSILPYFWIICSGIFLATAFLEIRRTETGYRYSWPKIMLMIFGGVGLLGGIIALSGSGSRFNSELVKEVPFYSQHMVITKESQWMQPTKGFLAGTIISAAEKKLEINDLNGNDWNVNIDEKTLVKPAASLSKGAMIKLIGEETAGNNFKALEIRPWSGKGMGNGQGGKMMNNGGNGGGLTRGNQK